MNMALHAGMTAPTFEAALDLHRRGELDAAQKKQLPRLIELKDLKGDLQSHSTWSDGSFTIEQMAEAGDDELLLPEHPLTTFDTDEWSW